MTDKEKIRKEVERLQKELVKEKEKGFGSDVDDACILELQNVLIYIDSLQEEPVSNDLEEAAHLYVDTTIEYFDSEDNPCCYSAFIAGAQWQKEQLIAKACVFLGSTDFCKYYNREFIEEFKKTMEG